MKQLTVLKLNMCPSIFVLFRVSFWNLLFQSEKIFINPESHLTLGLGTSLQFSSISEFISQASTVVGKETTTLTYRKIYCIQAMQDIKTNRNKISC